MQGGYHRQLCGSAYTKTRSAWRLAMSRRIRLFLFVLVATLGFSATACANVNGPRAECEGTVGSGC